MAKLTAEQRAVRSQARLRRDALAAEEDDRRWAERHAWWARDGMHLSSEEVAANAPCRGCGEPISDGLGDWPLQKFATPEEQGIHDEAWAAYRDRHADCRAHCWIVLGSRRWHCGFCCPPLPIKLDRETAERLRDLLFAPVAESDLSTWRLTLTCDHAVDEQQHVSNQSWTTRVVECPSCDVRRGVVEVERLDLRAVQQAKLATDLGAAEAKLVKQQAAAEKPSTMSKNSQSSSCASRKAQPVLSNARFLQLNILTESNIISYVKYMRFTA